MATGQSESSTHDPTRIRASEPDLAGPDRRQQREDAGLDDLRRDALQRTLLALIATAFVILLLTGISISQVGVTPAYLAFALAALAGIASRCLRHGVRVASVVLVAGLVIVVAGGSLLSPDVPVSAALCIPVLIATVMLGTGAGLAALLAGSAAIFWIAAAGTTISPWAVLGLGGGVGALVLACVVALWRSFYTVLDWSWASYAQAQQRSAELRERQVELGRLNQSLVLAYEQIKQTSAQLERARQTAEEARRLKAEFAASVSHELRTPLNLIIGLSELMVVTPHAGAPELPAVYRADVEAIYRNACHISNLIDDVLDLSQIEAHHMGLLKERVSLAEIVAQATATVRTLFENTGLTLDVRLPADLPPLFVDPVRIRQILINLLNNAVRFTEEGGVTITARIDDGQVVVEVTDSGVGISPQDLPGVFQEFWRSGEPRRGRRGSGLGLAVSKRFAELHGGNMWVSSRPGQGSTFSFSLPLEAKTVVQESGLSELHWRQLEQQTPHHRAVVLVEPEPETLRVFQRHLEGYQVVTAPDAASALRRAEEAAAEAIIVGATARRDAVRRAFQQSDLGRTGLRLPIVTCELHTSRHVAQDLGVAEYLVKPVSQQQLRRALRRFGHGCRDVVVIDDDPEMLHLLTRMIGALAPRCRVRTGSDGVRALELLRESPPDGVLLDLLMPGVNGYAVLAAMRRDPLLRAVPVVVITARGAEDEGLVAQEIEISQPGGLPAGEVCRWIRAGLEARQPPARSAAAPAHPGVPVGSPAWSENR